MTDAVVLDTDVVSYVFKRDSRARLYRPHLHGKLAVISFMTLAELERWALERNWGAARQAELNRFLSRFVVWPFDRSLCRRWAEITTQRGAVACPFRRQTLGMQQLRCNWGPRY